MHGSRYWTDKNWEYTFLAPQGNINESYKGTLLTVLKKFDKTLYVRSDSDSSDWREVKNTIQMPTLETSGDKTGWTLSSEKGILSNSGVLEKLEENLKKAGCSCSFMVINDEPEEETDGNSEVDLEAEDSEKPTLDEPSRQTEKVEKKSGKEEKKKKQKSKKSNKVQVGQGIQTKTINSLKDRKKSQEASEKHGLTTYKVVSNENNSVKNVKQAWIRIGTFIKNNAKTYKDVKPIGYGTKKHWHSWHKSWMEKVFVQNDKTKFWLMKLNETLAKELKTYLNGLNFTIETYTAGNSLGTKPIISNESKPEDTEIKSLKGPEKTADTPNDAGNSTVQHEPPNRKPPETPKNKEQVTATSPQINENISNAKTRPLPDKSKSSTSPSTTRSEMKNDLLEDIRKGPKLKKAPTEANQKIDEDRDNDLAGQLRKVMEVRRKDIEDDEDPVEGDKKHAIMEVLTKQKPGIYVAMLQLIAPYKDIKTKLSENVLCPYGTGKMWLARKDEDGYDSKKDITSIIDEQTLEKCAITGMDGPVGWYVKVLTEIESDEWSENEDDSDFLPSVKQMDALQTMRDAVPNKGARLVSISTPLPALKALVKNPPTLPTRRVKPDPITNEREDQTAKKGSTEKKPAKFIGLEDNVTTQGQSGRSRILVIVKYSDIEEIRKTHPTEKVRDVSKGIYKEFNPEKLAKVLDDFNKTNGVLKPLMLKGSRGTGQPNAGGYKTVLASPVKQEYKNTGEVVSTWNLIISKPDGTKLNQAEVQKIIELVKILKDHGVAVRREKDLKLQ